MVTQKKLPIAVDLDGTLLYTDILHEQCLKLAHNPIELCLIPFWLSKGKAYLKKKLSERTTINPKTLPYNLELIEWLKEQKRIGHQIVLCTATDAKIAKEVATHLSIFDDVIASDGKKNIAGEHKREALVNRYGEQEFIYVGNSHADLHVWKSSAKSIVVNACARLIRKVSQISDLIKTFPKRSISIKSWCNTFRIHQYLKNLLLFVPIAAAHQITHLELLNLVFLAFISFSLCASAVYITNDLIDLESDRQHPHKRNRPFASGIVPIEYGLIISPIILTVSFLIAFFIGNQFLLWLAVYFVLTLAYSLQLKRLVLIDCLTLTTLYTLRIIAGASAVAISLSFWLLAFSIFIFLSLAFIKRYTELELQARHGKKSIHGRGYLVEDKLIIQTLGVAAGYSSILVLALYLNSESVINLYLMPEVIWLAIPLLLFWVSWMWMTAHRGEMHDDPIVFAIKDPVSLIMGLLLIIIFVVASFHISI